MVIVTIDLVAITAYTYFRLVARFECWNDHFSLYSLRCTISIKRST